MTNRPSTPHLEELLRELKFAWRRLSHRPLTTALVVLPAAITVATGITATSVIHTAFFQTSPFPHPSQLVEIWASPKPGNHHQSDLLTLARGESVLADRLKAVSHVAMYSTRGSFIGSAGERPDEVKVGIVEGQFFDALGVRMRRGRGFSAGRSDASEIVISQSLERRMFGSGEVLGRTARLWGATFTIIGVVREGQEYPREASAWIQASDLPRASQPGAWFGVARLLPQRSINELQSELDVVASNMKASGADSTGMAAVAFADLQRGTIGPTIPLTIGTVAAVLAIVLLSLSRWGAQRAMQQRKSMAIRLAIGAHATRLLIVRVAEPLVIGFMIAVIAAPVSLAMTRRVAQLSPVLMQMRFGGWEGIGFVALLVATIATMSFSGAITPARDVYAQLLRSADVRPARRRTFGLPTVMVFEPAIGFVLLMYTAMLSASLYHWRGINVGFDAEHVVFIRPAWMESGMGDAQQRAMSEELERELRVASISGMKDVALWRTRATAYPPPPMDDVMAFDPIVRAGAGRTPPYIQEVGPTFFATLGIPILEGRGFNASDTRGSAPVAIISRGAAQRWWPGERAIGRRIRIGSAGDGTWVTIIGVSDDIGNLTQLDRIVGERGKWQFNIFRPMSQTNDATAAGWGNTDCFFCSRMFVAARVGSQAAQSVAQIREIVQRSAGGLPPASVVTAMSEEMDAYGPHEFGRAAKILGTLGILSLVAALIAVIGNTLEMLQRSSRTWAIRIALGARPASVKWRVAGAMTVECLWGVGVGAVLLLLLQSVATRWVFLRMSASGPSGMSTGTDWRLAALIAMVMLVAVSAASLLFAARHGKFDIARLLSE